MVIKKICKGGNINIPKKLREQLTSDEVKISVMSIEVAEGVVKECVVLEPTKCDKKVVTRYE